MGDGEVSKASMGVSDTRIKASGSSVQIVEVLVVIYLSL